MPSWRSDPALKALGLVCAGSAAAAVFLTESRGGLLALLGVLIIAVWFLEPRLLARIKIIFAGALVAILLLPSLLAASNACKEWMMPLSFHGSRCGRRRGQCFWSTPF